MRKRSAAVSDVLNELAVWAPGQASPEIQSRFLSLVRSTLGSTEGVGLFEGLEELRLWDWIEVAVPAVLAADLVEVELQEWAALHAYAALRRHLPEVAEGRALEVLARKPPAPPAARSKVVRPRPFARPRALAVLGAVAALRGRDDDALEWYEQALALTYYPNRCAVLIEYAALELRIGWLERVRETLRGVDQALYYETSATRKHALKAATHSLRAGIAVRLERWGDAVDLERCAFKSARKSRSGELVTETSVRLARYLAIVGDVKGAKRALSRITTAVTNQYDRGEITRIRASLLLAGGAVSDAGTTYLETIKYMLPAPAVDRYRWRIFCRDVMHDLIRYSDVVASDRLSAKCGLVLVLLPMTAERVGPTTPSQVGMDIQRAIDQVRDRLSMEVEGQFETSGFVINLNAATILKKRSGEKSPLEGEALAILGTLAERRKTSGSAWVSRQELFEALMREGLAKGTEENIKGIIRDMRRTLSWTREDPVVGRVGQGGGYRLAV